MDRLPVSVAELVAGFGGTALGCGDGARITGFAALADAGEGDLSFYSSAKLRGALRETKAGVVALRERDAGLRRGPRIVVPDPRAWFAMVLNEYGARKEPPPGVHPDASIDPSARLGADVRIGAGAAIAAGAAIGDRTQVRAGAAVADGCAVGSDCILHEGCVIGSEGFGFIPGGSGGMVRISHQGAVRIGDGVEIGANSCVDRGMLGDTVIGSGTKIDNLVQIGHNVRIGENCVLCGKVGIGGSAEIGSGCTLGGMVGVADHVRIAPGVQVMSGSKVTSDLRSAGVYGGVLPTFSRTEQGRLWRRLLKLARGDE